MSNTVRMTRGEWNVLLAGVQDSLRNYDVWNSPLSKVYQEIQFQLDEQEY